MNFLVDVNVWIAIALAGHVHREAARSWFYGPAAAVGTKLYFCRVTQKGFLRLLTNEKVMSANALKTAGAWQYYDSLVEDDRIGFAQEPPALEGEWRDATERHNAGANFWTDAYLAAFASASGLTIVTFDRAFPHYRGTRVKLLAGS